MFRLHFQGMKRHFPHIIVAIHKIVTCNAGSSCTEFCHIKGLKPDHQCFTIYNAAHIFLVGKHDIFVMCAKQFTRLLQYDCCDTKSKDVFHIVVIKHTIFMLSKYVFHTPVFTVCHGHQTLPWWFYQRDMLTRDSPSAIAMYVRGWFPD